MATGGQTPHHPSNNTLRNTRPFHLLSRFENILDTAEGFLQCVRYWAVDADAPRTHMDFLSPHMQSRASYTPGQGNGIRDRMPGIQNLVGFLAEIDRFCENIGRLERPTGRRSSLSPCGAASVSNSNAALAQVPHTETSTNEDTTIQGAIICPICMGQSLSREPTATKCGHVFCGPCVNKAIRLTQKCPVCNARVYTRGLLRLYL